LWAEGFLPSAGLPAVLAGGAALLLLCWLWACGPLRLVLALLSRSLWWLRVSGRRNLPARGAALLVCNPVSPLDWLLLLAAWRRPIRPVVLAGWARRGLLRRLLRWAGAITVEGAADRAGLESALDRGTCRFNARTLFTGCPSG
jgi:1-acyl-sn-glycerol-3-phosphate acyltransferase